MKRRATRLLLVLLCLLPAASGGAEVLVLSLEQALALARERAPALLSAGERIDEARGRLTAARPLLHENPVLEAAAGPRLQKHRTPLAAEVGLSQGLELAGERGSRIAAAGAGVEHASADRDDALRLLLRDVAIAFHRLHESEEQHRVALRSEAVAADVAHSSERRYRADEVPYLDVNVSKAGLASARAQSREAAAQAAIARADLGRLLGLADAQGLATQGSLPVAAVPELGVLRERLAERADLRALAAELAQAEAEARLARAESWPDVAVGASYERDDPDDVVLAGLTLELPVFDRGQGARAETNARVRRLRRELAVERTAAESELTTAYFVYREREAAALELETSALPLLDENEKLVHRSYEAGQIGLAELVVLRRETLALRSETLKRRLLAAIAASEVLAASGDLE
jgi:cobalt-zinc-cadmium efflux system outer membrane protein